MDTSDKIERKKELTRLRQKRFYDANRLKVLEKKKEQYNADLGKSQEPNEILESKSNVNILDKFNKIDRTDETMGIYMNSLKQFLTQSECINLRKCLLNDKKVIEAIDNAEKNGKPYSIASKKLMIQAILVAIKELKIKVSNRANKAYNDYYDKLTIQYSDAIDEKKDKLPSMEQYMKLVLERFGADSTEYLLIKLYDEVPVRDDFGKLNIVSTQKQANENKELNYIVIPKSGVASVILNDYKTKSKYGQLVFKLSTELTKDIKKYIKSNPTDDNTLFKSKGTLTQLVGKINKEVNLTGGINTIRHIKITTLFNDPEFKDMSVEKRMDLSKKMGNSVVIQKTYLRQLL